MSSPSVGKCNVAIFLSSSLARSRRPSCQPETVANGEDAKRFRGLMLSTFTPSKTSEPAKSISLSKYVVFPTNALFFSKWSRVMSVSDTTVSMAATWSHPCTPAGRRRGHSWHQTHEHHNQQRATLQDGRVGLERHLQRLSLGDPEYTPEGRRWVTDGKKHTSAESRRLETKVMKSQLMSTPQ